MMHPPDRDGYFGKVWEIVRQIPAGRVSSYGQIAAMIPAPPGVDPGGYDRVRARWVGQAMNAVPPGSDVPWQRVINSQGQISLPRGSAAAEEQRNLLEAEGVEFGLNERIDFADFGWEGPAPAWCEAHGYWPAPPLGSRRKGPDQLSMF